MDGRIVDVDSVRAAVRLSGLGLSEERCLALLQTLAPMLDGIARLRDLDLQEIEPSGTPDPAGVSCDEARR